MTGLLFAIAAAGARPARYVDGHTWSSSARRRGGLSKAILGSVARGVVATVRRPVPVINPVTD
ncbi:MAG: hypothetical protein AB7L91_02275 [Dehalococcoidia bacterium]